MIARLSPFIGMLEHNRLLDFKILGDSDEHFDNRFKIQKYVYLAKYFGLDLGYDYSIYLHGPYSTSLADDYYAIAKSSIPRTGNVPTFDSKSFLSFVANKDLDWLEAATTLLSLNETFKDKKCLLDRTANMKVHIPKSKISSALSELETTKLVAFQTI